ncbi:sulfur carrier protein ThiS [Clostridium sp. KNHs216]|jgi:thiamine biosynthesis protein ThiS|uniref:sulfur carrier protein ThiS n=1 Tax=Eubacteriales TaxID=186802 RepID=UPI00056DD941|nr:sulfur carrier protein ThiS [Clostridium sp. KNHs216]MBE6831524.1 sulfur carrier protein ThiS [Oscillospiraceae bacterium]TQI68510.1 sulfur carrier protein [Clostridium sp. KNHs216]
MIITINGKQNSFEAEMSVQELLEKTEVDMQEYVTVQLNDEIISRKDFSSIPVRDGDRVEFLYYMGGGQYKKIA